MNKEFATYLKTCFKHRYMMFKKGENKEYWQGAAEEILYILVRYKKISDLEHSILSNLFVS